MEVYRQGIITLVFAIDVAEDLVNFWFSSTSAGDKAKAEAKAETKAEAKAKTKEKGKAA